LTNIPGVFAVGTATGPKDIVDSIVSGSSIAGKVSLWLQGELRDSFQIEEFNVIRS
jgi:heterodisulfide reductase subunit A-like polyferredoxin